MRSIRTFRKRLGCFCCAKIPSVIGSTFFLMERRRGIVIRDSIPRELAAIPDYPRLVSEAFIDCLVRLHSIDVSQPALSSLGKPEGFVERQVRGWAERWNRAKTEELPEMDRIVRWLHDRLPPSVDATLVHNDYKLDNVMLRPSGDRVEAVLDWEMTTIGDPLADLGLTMCYWTWASVAAEDDPHPATPGVDVATGLVHARSVSRTIRAANRARPHAHPVPRSSRAIQAGRDSATDLLSFSSRADAG